MHTTRYALISISICTLIFFTAWYDSSHAHLLTSHLNSMVMHYIYVPAEQNANWHKLMLKITGAGGGSITTIILGIIFVTLLVKKHYKILIYCTVAALCIFVITGLCKHLIHSPRPTAPFEPDSFPSGHVIRATAWCGLVLLLEQLRVFNFAKAWRIVLIAIPLLVGYSRLALGMHWFSDVLGAYALVSGIYLLAYIPIKTATLPEGRGFVH